MMQLMVNGTIAESHRGQLDPDDIALLPRFALETLELPEDLQGPVEVEFARVLLGASIHDLRHPGLEWRYDWNRFLPASEGFFSLPPDRQWYDYSPRVIGLFVTRAMNLNQIREVGGRPSLVDPDCQWYFDEADRYVSEGKGNTPTKAEFVKFTGRPESTMRGHLTRCHLWPWEVFTDRVFMSPRARSK
jgi:hypothetical protein